MDQWKEFAVNDQYLGRDWYFGTLPSSQRDQEDHENGNIIVRTTTIEMVLMKWQKCNMFHNSKWYTGPKLIDEPVLKRKGDTFRLCLDADLAHGLDLSFVTHIFLLEAINDAARLEQVTARAHRF